MILEGFVYGKRYKLLAVTMGFLITIGLYINLILHLTKKQKEGYDRIGVFTIPFVITASKVIIAMLVIVGCEVLIKYIQYSIKIHILYLASLKWCELDFKNSKLYDAPDVLDKEYIIEFANSYNESFKSFCDENNFEKYELVDIMILSIRYFKRRVLRGYLEDRYIEYLKEKEE